MRTRTVGKIVAVAGLAAAAWGYAAANIGQQRPDKIVDEAHRRAVELHPRQDVLHPAQPVPLPHPVDDQMMASARGDLGSAVMSKGGSTLGSAIPGGSGGAVLSHQEVVEKKLRSAMNRLR